MQRSIKPIDEKSRLESLFFNKIWTYERFNAALCKSLNNQIVAGFAKGMHYVSKVPWTRLVVNKLVGTYEMELLPFFESLDDNPPAIIFDIGAAEGYYSVGCLLRWHSAKVIAWEMDEQAQKIMSILAEKNKVQERLSRHGICTPSLLEKAERELHPDLIIMDIEGEELNLCTPETIALGAKTHWVIECHAPEIVATLQKRFSKTHRVEIIENRSFSFDDVKVKLPKIYTFLPQDRWRIVREGREIPTPWLIARPK